MKKFISIVLATIMMCSLCACSSEPASVPTTPPVSGSVEAPSTVETLPTESEINIPVDVEIVNYSVGKDCEDKECIIVSVKWTNNTSETCSYWLTIEDTAYQGGIELESSFPSYSDETAAEKYDAQNLELRPGASIEVDCYFILRNNSDDVEFEFTWYNWETFEYHIVATGICSLV